MFDVPEQVLTTIETHPFPLVFTALSGAHLYGFASKDSDWDVRGTHCLPLEAVIGLGSPEETHELMYEDDGVELDVVTYDIRKFCKLIVKKNGNVLEQVTSPHVLSSSPAHEELRDIALGCLSRHHFHHYKGLAMNRWRFVDKRDHAEVKPVLYAYRAVLTGLGILEQGIVNANLAEMNAEVGDEAIADLLVRKQEGEEHERLPAALLEEHRANFQGYLERLESAFEASSLPENCEGGDRLNDWLIRQRTS